MRTNCVRLSSALLALALGSVAAADVKYLAGPVSNVASDGSSISLLASPVAIGPSTKLFVGGRQVNAGRFIHSIQPNSFVYAEIGDAPLDGKSLATKVSINDSPYVAGVTPVFVGGKVSVLDGSTGQIRVDGLSVDINNLPAAVLSKLSAGDVVEICGIQPEAQLPIVLSTTLSISIDTANAPARLTNGQVASQGISGSGFSTTGISGSGFSTQGISGSGVSVQGISGSGSQTQGISGSGKAIQGISGSGLESQGISGSGTSTRGISGSGSPTD